MSSEGDAPHTGDTIVAIATAPGTGAVGLIRLSGGGAVKTAAPLLRLASGLDLGAARARVLHRASVLDPATGEVADEALVTVMRGPRSYTGEDVVEISCHGNPVVLANIVSMLVDAGARLAEPGEFTRRAFLNGRIDLVQAESVAMLIAARSERAARLAVKEMSGTVSATVRDVREELLGLVAGIEVALDFPEDEIGVSCVEASSRCSRLARRLERLSAGVRRGRMVHAGLTVAIVGAPNVGKSSLLNSLLGRDRAIVSPIAGTTRDLVDGEIMINGIGVRLVDGAGLGEPRDALDAESMRRTRGVLGESDAALVVLDRSRPLAAEDSTVMGLTEGMDRLVIANKSDMPPAWSLERVDCVCSARTGDGLTELRDRLEAWVRERLADDAEEFGAVASLRVAELIDRSREAVDRAAAGLGDSVPFEAALVDLHAARRALEQGLGLDADEALLDRIFSTFCVGK